MQVLFRCFLSYDSYQVLLLFSSFLECSIPTLISSTRRLTMERFAHVSGLTSGFYYGKENMNFSMYWFKTKMFSVRNLYCLKIVWIDVGTLLFSLLLKSECLHWYKQEYLYRVSIHSEMDRTRPVLARYFPGKISQRLYAKILNSIKSI